MKICNECGLEKNENEFEKGRRKCKDCRRNYRISTKERFKETQKRWYLKNKVKLLQQHQKYVLNNEDKIKQYNKIYMEKYRRENKILIKNLCTKYYQQNREKLLSLEQLKRKSPVLFNIYSHQISYAEEVRRDPETKKILQVKCTNCKKWFSPTKSSISNRIAGLEGKGRGENRLYCSKKCKRLCSIYNQKKYPKGVKPYVFRDMQKEWADMVKERDGWKCVKCGSTEGLIAHHKEGIHWNPIESADIDMGIPLCEGCEKEVHSIEGCSYYDMRCN